RVELYQMEIEGRAHAYETGNLPARLELLDHLRERQVRYAVAVVGQEYLLILDEMANRHQALADIPPDARINQRHTPVRRRFAKQGNIFSKIRDDAVAVRRRVNAQKIVLNDISLVS